MIRVMNRQTKMIWRVQDEVSKKYKKTGTRLTEWIGGVASRDKVMRRDPVHQDANNYSDVTV